MGSITSPNEDLSSGTRHPQVLVTAPDGDNAIVDEALGPLVLAFVTLGLSTSNSCQGDPGDPVWLEFTDSTDALAFLAIVAPRYEEDGDSQYQRVAGAWVNPGNWQYNCHVFDDDVDWAFFDNGSCQDEPSSGIPVWRFSVSVRFPREDLPAVTTAVQQAVISSHTDATPRTTVKTRA